MNKEYDLTIEEERARGTRFRIWAEDDGLNDCINDIRAAYQENIAKSHPNDVAGRENAYLAIRNLENIKKQILQVIGRGKVAADTLQNIEKNADIVRDKKVFRLI